MQRHLGGALLDAVTRVAASGHFIVGPEVERFERALASSCGARHAVGVACGSDALVLGLRCAGVVAGDVVVTTALSFVATAEAALRCGAKLAFIDVEPHTLTLCPKALQRYLADCSLRDGVPYDEHRQGPVRALLPVHLYGRVADLQALAPICRRAGMVMVQDAAQAVGGYDASGRSLTTRGPVGLSFFPTKNLGAWGDAGALLLDDHAHETCARRLRQHGRDDDGTFVHSGYNSRLDELQAAILHTKLAHLPAQQQRRRQLAHHYREQLLASRLAPRLVPPPALGDHDVAHLFTVRINQRRTGQQKTTTTGNPLRHELRQHLRQCGIATRVYYARGLHREPAFAHYQRPGPALPHTERACREVLSLPLHPYLSDQQVTRVVSAIANFFSRRKE